MGKPAPIPDQASAFFWEGAARGELLVQRCEDCLALQYPPTVVCEKCHSRDIGPARVSGRGTLYALTVMHQAFLPVFADQLPFTIALVDLDDAPGARLLTNIVEADPAALAAGDPLEVVFEPRGDYAVPQFRPARPAGPQGQHQSPAGAA
jgi:uncharacterized OB-fold protein